MFLSKEDIKKIGFKFVGENVLISDKAVFYGAENISISDNVRIDDFCVLSGNISIGSYVHIAVGCMLFAGSAGIELKDFSGLSSRCVIYAMSDDYTGLALTNPTIPDKYRKIQSGKVVLEKHSIVGTGSTILPNVILAEGTSVGAMSLIMKSTQPWKIYFGVPARIVGDRCKDLLDLEKQLLEERGDANE